MKKLVIIEASDHKRIDEKAILILIGDGPLRNEIENKINVLLYIYRSSISSCVHQNFNREAGSVG